MPKASDQVLSTDVEIKNAKVETRTDFRVKGAQGLQLRVTPAGSKTWSLAYKSPATGKWAKIALGAYPTLGLKAAKEAATKTLADVLSGADPIYDRRKAEAIETFAVLASRYMAEHSLKNGRGDGRVGSWSKEAQRMINADILPVLGKLKADAITKHHVAHAVQRVADRGSLVTSDKVLALIRAIFNWACGNGCLDHNPTAALKKRAKIRAKNRVLAEHEIHTLWRMGSNAEAMSRAIGDALRLQLLTGTRISEVIQAPRAEFDLAAAMWTIPASRTKSKRELKLPLAREAVALIAAIIEREDAIDRSRAVDRGEPFQPSTWLFPSRSSMKAAPSAISEKVATRAIVRARPRFVIEGIKESFNTHDLRRTVATNLGDMGIASDVIERILNHAPRTVTVRHYNHAKHVQPMRDAMERWAARLTEIAVEKLSVHRTFSNAA